MCHLGPISVADLNRNVATWGSPAGPPEKQECENQRGQQGCLLQEKCETGFLFTAQVTLLTSMSLVRRLGPSLTQYCPGWGPWPCGYLNFNVNALKVKMTPVSLPLSP